MEEPNSEDKNGVSKLPIGFRFHPTDEELLLHYLKRKVYSFPLPANVISESDVFHSNPWDLPGDLKEKRYFFSKSKSIIMNKCCSGYWKSSGKDKQIVAPGTNLIIGLKKSLVFYKGKSLKTRWFMHEFCLVGSFNSPFLTQKLMMQVGDWVVCRMYQRKRKGKKHHGMVAKKPRILQGTDDENLGINGDRNELGLSFAPDSSSLCSSGITDDISCNDLDQEAISTLNFSF
ncbi:hypothetical protein RD792_010425 [Penstemon davidsonii]|uniref:NAC domain-containing protein n=1 Tax=Penstemon davidsonii TaxID=160366 RepID=A0ABR0D1U3_9LAMI|nr:hypothetical protein RD792_010425 [Penstemon davidsonii]